MTGLAVVSREFSDEKDRIGQLILQVCIFIFTKNFKLKNAGCIDCNTHIIYYCYLRKSMVQKNKIKMAEFSEKKTRDDTTYR